MKPLLAVEAITFDFGNTLVQVDRAGLRRVVEVTAGRVAERSGIRDVAGFLLAWAEERERQFRVEVPRLREVDLAQRVVRVLARMRGMEPPAEDDGWDDAAAVRLTEPDEVGAAVEAYSGAFVASMPSVAGATEALGALAGRGFRLAIVSNWPLATTVDRYVEVQGWSRLFEAIVVSQRVGVIKPHPAIFARAVAALGTPAERILHVGDDWIADIVGARAAGWHAAYFQGRQAESPLPSSVPDAQFEPDFVIDDLAEVSARVTRWPTAVATG
ncbi:MAG TPA: HAD family hydrolase [Candidatus Eisenbacteria bacterium]|nr:HAD family hydrolase [Candidatus Eisenbacteria bacterium]